MKSYWPIYIIAGCVGYLAIFSGIWSYMPRLDLSVMVIALTTTIYLYFREK